MKSKILVTTGAPSGLSGFFVFIYLIVQSTENESLIPVKHTISISESLLYLMIKLLYSSISNKRSLNTVSSKYKVSALKSSPAGAYTISVPSPFLKTISSDEPNALPKYISSLPAPPIMVLTPVAPDEAPHSIMSLPSPPSIRLFPPRKSIISSPSPPLSVLLPLLEPTI